MKVRNCDSPEIPTGIFSICLIAMIDCRAPCQAAAAHHVDHENYSNHSSDNTVSLQAGEVYRKRTNESIFWGKFAQLADEGHPQGGRAPTAPTNCLLFSPPYQLSSFFGQETGLQSPKTFGICDSALRSAQFQALCPEKGAHKGRPYPIQAASRGFVPI